MPNKFKLSDESLNSNGIIIRTAGIDLERFRGNPVMYYNHDRAAGVIGRWENLEIVGTELYGVPVFDESTEIGKRVKNQVDNGFIRAASVGVDELESIEKDGYIEIVKCILYEVSVCDIPSNQNTLMQLYANETPLTLAAFLSSNVPGSKEEWERLLALLHLEPGADLSKVIEAVTSLIPVIEPEKKVKEAFEGGFISKFDRDDILTFYAGSPERMQNALTDRVKAKRKEIEREVNDLLTKQSGNLFGMFKLSVNDNSLLRFKEFVMKNPGGMLPLLRKMPERNMFSIKAYIESGKQGDQGRAAWTLDDYRRKDPKALRDDPELYRRLLKEEEEHHV